MKRSNCLPRREEPRAGGASDWRELCMNLCCIIRFMINTLRSEVADNNFDPRHQRRLRLLKGSKARYWVDTALCYEWSRTLFSPFYSPILIDTIVLRGYSTIYNWNSSILQMHKWYGQEFSYWWWLILIIVFYTLYNLSLNFFDFVAKIHNGSGLPYGVY